MLAFVKLYTDEAKLSPANFTLESLSNGRCIARLLHHFAPSSFSLPSSDVDNVNGTQRHSEIVLIA